MARRQSNLLLNGSPHIPPAVHKALPSQLRRAIREFEAVHERDVFLTAVLGVLSGCLPNLVGDHSEGKVPLNFNVCVLASAGSGKGAIRFARRIGEIIDRRIHEEREEDNLNVNHSEKKQPAASLPKVTASTRQVFIGGNSSERALIETIHGNNGRGVLFETETVTLSKLFGGISGDARDLILKSFHGEPATISRKGLQLHIAQPAFSVVVSGTPESLRSIIDSVESGLYSRFAFYQFSAAPEWKSHRPRRIQLNRDAIIDSLAEKVDELYQILERRTEKRKGSLIVRLKAKHWELLDSTFEARLQNLWESGSNTSLEASVKRSAVIAFRIACILTVLRAYDDGKPLDRLKQIYASDDDATAGITLASIYLTHALTTAGLFDGRSQKPLDRRREGLLTSLPETEFSTATALRIGEAFHPPIPARTTMRYLDAFAQAGMIEKLGHGIYKKATR